MSVSSGSRRPSQAARTWLGRWRCWERWPLPAGCSSGAAPTTAEAENSSSPTAPSTPPLPMPPAPRATRPSMAPPTRRPTTSGMPTERTAIWAPIAEACGASSAAFAADGDTGTMPSGMLDLARGPFIVGVADRAQALGACATLAPTARPFDLVEARVDLFSGQRLDDADLDVCARLEASGTPVLVTIRSERQGGRFAAGEPERLALFRAALAVASWADVEDDAGIVDDVAALVRARPGGQLVVSHHDFAATPPLDLLLAVVDGCHAAAPNAVAKVATAVKSADDRAVLRALLASRPERTAVIGMGAADDGLRVELAAAGSLLAYGFIAGATAPGQVSAEALHACLLTASPRYAARQQRSGSART